MKRMIIVLLFFSVFSLSGQNQNVCYSRLERARQAVRQDNYALAWELFEQLENCIEIMPLPVREMILWEAADLCNQRGAAMETTEERIFFFNVAIRKWQRYFDWYQQLSIEQRNQLAGTKNNRIGMAVHNLGISYINRYNTAPRGTETGQIFEMFDQFTQIPSEYFIPKTIEEWKVYLMKYSNNGADAGGHGFMYFVRRCFQNEHDCYERWIEYKDFLKDCLENNRNLNSSLRGRFTREISLIESIR